jgi:desulfoferrodoxin (superoxide reductase-like protein)
MMPPGQDIPDSVEAALDSGQGLSDRSKEKCMSKENLKSQGLSRRDFMKTTGMILAAGVVLRAVPVSANKSSVRIVAPETAAAGEQITIELHVSHKGNSFFHYTDRVQALINGQEAQRWEYSARNRPESENFVITLQHTMNEPIEISAEANCNMHGSDGVAKANVALS